MARMHTKRKGKSKSRKPVLDKGSFGNGSEGMQKEEVEKLILDYAKQGMAPAAIGEKLKKEHGVKYVRQAIGLRMNEFLKQKGAAHKFPSDMLDLMTKAVRIRRHLESNKQDVYGRVRLIRIEAKILRLSRYYGREGVLPSGWKYNPREAELIVKGRV